MFDDQIPAAQGGVPPNLPIAEPDDMFGSVDPVNIDAPDFVSAPSMVDSNVSEAPILESQKAQSTNTDIEISLPSAVTAGKLQPRDVLAENNSMPYMSQPAAQIETMPSPHGLGRMSTMPTQLSDNSNSSMVVDEMKSPNFMRTLLIIGIIVVFVIVAGGGIWYVVSNFFIDTTPTVVVPTIDVVDVSPEVLESEQTNNSNETNSDTTISATDAPTAIPLPTDDTISQGDIVDNQILFGDDIDIDEDGLSDEREVEFGIDPRNWDTDGDELSDGDEVLNWGTEPLNPDTDGDGFSDGAEVKSGYSPLVGGGARLFDIVPPTAVGNTVVNTN